MIRNTFYSKTLVSEEGTVTAPTVTVEGENIIFTTANGLLLGRLWPENNTTPAGSAIEFGRNTNVGTYGIALGLNATGGNDGIAMGQNATSAGTTDGISLGRDSKADSISTTAVGHLAEARGSRSAAFGYNAKVPLGIIDAVAIGQVTALADGKTYIQHATNTSATAKFAVFDGDELAASTLSAPAAYNGLIAANDYTLGTVTPYVYVEQLADKLFHIRGYFTTTGTGNLLNGAIYTLLLLPDTTDYGVVDNTKPIGGSFNGYFTRATSEIVPYIDMQRTSVTVAGPITYIKLDWRFSNGLGDHVAATGTSVTNLDIYFNIV